MLSEIYTCYMLVQDMQIVCSFTNGEQKFTRTSSLIDENNANQSNNNSKNNVQNYPRRFQDGKYREFANQERYQGRPNNRDVNNEARQPRPKSFQFDGQENFSKERDFHRRPPRPKSEDFGDMDRFRRQNSHDNEQGGYHRQNSKEHYGHDERYQKQRSRDGEKNHKYHPRGENEHFNRQDSRDYHRQDSRDKRVQFEDSEYEPKRKRQQGGQRFSNNKENNHTVSLLITFMFNDYPKKNV